jgi:arabinose-5-phosphate isomerase
MSNPSQPETPADLVRIQAAALAALAQRLDGPMHDPFTQACTIFVDAAQNNRRVVLVGVGKSGLIARKIAATLVSTGTPAQFLHPAEALHGDIGILNRGDVLLALSYSGETEEILRLLPAVPRIGATLISFCGCATSTLAQASVITLDVSVSREACSLQLAPTASTTVMLALGDALAIEVSRTLGFKAQDFADLHPGGQLGRRLTSVRKLMHTGEALPSVGPTATMPEIIHEMSARRLGMTTVQSGGKLLGVISDGDLRRLFESDGPEAFHKIATNIMNANPLTISPDPLAPDALLLMEQRKITALVVTENGAQNSPVLGVLHIHDLWDVAPPPV